MTHGHLGPLAAGARLRRPGSLAAILLVAGAWLLLLRPTTLGGPAGYVSVAGTSMEPAIHGGDLVITQSADDYEVGEVVAYRAAGGIVIHRIVGGDAGSGFVVQGDHRAQPDLWRPTPNEIIGRAWLQLPMAGAVLGRLGHSIAPAVLAGTAVFLAVMGSPGRRSSAARTDPSHLPSRERVGFR